MSGKMLLFSTINFFVLFKIAYFLNRFLQAVIVGFGITSKHSCVCLRTSVSRERVWWRPVWDAGFRSLCHTLATSSHSSGEGKIQLR